MWDSLERLPMSFLSILDKDKDIIINNESNDALVSVFPLLVIVFRAMASSHAICMKQSQTSSVMTISLKRSPRSHKKKYRYYICLYIMVNFYADTSVHCPGDGIHL